MPREIEDIVLVEHRKRPTGLAGLDFQIGGGFPAGNSVVICGTPLVGIDILARQFWKAEEQEATYLMIDAAPEEGMIACRDSPPEVLMREMGSDRVVVDSLSTIIREYGIDAAITLMTDGVEDIRKNEGLALFVLYEGIHTKIEEFRVMRAANIYLTLSQELHGNEIERKLAVNKIPYLDVPTRSFPFNIRPEGLDLSTTARVV
jgi:KaiC/GvpD/RAD55 family RecA-like ATPase